MSQEQLLEQMSQAQLNRLNETCAKYTNFSSFEELVSPAVNYRPVFYYNQDLSNSIKRDLSEVCKAYNTFMQRIHDPRRIYEC